MLTLQSYNWNPAARTGLMYFRPPSTRKPQRAADLLTNQSIAADCGQVIFIASGFLLRFTSGPRTVQTVLAKSTMKRQSWKTAMGSVLILQAAPRLLSTYYQQLLEFVVRYVWTEDECTYMNMWIRCRINEREKRPDVTSLPRCTAEEGTCIQCTPQPGLNRLTARYVRPRRLVVAPTNDSDKSVQSCMHWAPLSMSVELK